MGSTSNIDLLNIAKYFSIHNLVAVCQKDKLMMYPLMNNSFYIINSQDSTEGTGTHWTCLFLNKSQSYFFDSYGASPSNSIVEYCKKFTKNLLFNNFIVQDLDSDNCGYYCIGWILFMNRNCNKKYSNFKFVMNDFLNAFNDDTKDNDKILEGIMRIYSNKSPITVLNKFYNQ
jgi:hypothetical protein